MSNYQMSEREKEQSKHANAQWKWLVFLHSYYDAWLFAFFSMPFLVGAYYCFSQFLIGTPEPEWWLEFEKMQNTFLMWLWSKI